MASPSPLYGKISNLFYSVGTIACTYIPPHVLGGRTIISIITIKPHFPPQFPPVTPFLWFHRRPSYSPISSIGTSHMCVGLGTEFRSEKIPRNRLGMISVIPRKKLLIPMHSEFRGRANSEARNGTERNGIPRKNEVLRNSHGLYDYSDINRDQTGDLTRVKGA